MAQPCLEQSACLAPQSAGDHGNGLGCSQAISEVGLLLDEWGKIVDQLGWMADDLFGVHLTVPLSRMDHMGLVWLLKREYVVGHAEGRRSLKWAPLLPSGEHWKS